MATTTTKTTTYNGVVFIVENTGRIFDRHGREKKQFQLGKYMYVRAYSRKKYLEGRMKGKKNPTATMLILVSRLVCQAFHPRPDIDELQCDHIDNDPLNNTASNLRWVTRKQNNSRKHARQMKAMNYKSVRRPDMFVKGTNEETGEVRYFVNGVDFSEAIGCSKPLPYIVLDGRTPTAYGWRLEWVSKDLPECEDFKRKVEEEAARRKREKMDAYNEKRRRESAERRAIRLKRKELKMKRLQKQKELIRQMRENERRQRLERKANDREERLLRRKERAEAMERARREKWERHIVLQCDLNGNTIAEFRTAHDAENMTGLRGIGKAIRRGEPWRGYIWKYKVPREDETIYLQEEEEENNETAMETIQ